MKKQLQCQISFPEGGALVGGPKDVPKNSGERFRIPGLLQNGCGAWILHRHFFTHPSALGVSKKFTGCKPHSFRNRSTAGKGKNPFKASRSETLVDLAGEKSCSVIAAGRMGRSSAGEFALGAVVQKLVYLAGDLTIWIVS